MALPPGAVPHTHQRGIDSHRHRPRGSGTAGTLEANPVWSSVWRLAFGEQVV